MNRSLQKCADALYVGALILYLTAGMMLAPFHGDESTIIHKAVDWYTLIQLHNPAALLYNPAAKNADQDLRIQDGVVSSYAIGAGWMIFGLPLQSLPGVWDWGGGWDYNIGEGHMPTPPMLFVSRLTSTALAAISIALIFAAARQIGGRSTAWIASALYTAMPAVLLNARRAMFEGATLFSVALVLLTGLYLARRSGAYRLRDWLLFGAAIGLAMASKHNLIVTIVPVLLALLWLGRRKLRATILYAAASACVGLFLFLLLNPTWWGAPLYIPGRVLQLRTELAKQQADTFGGYTSLLDRVAALYTAPVALPQYFEDKRGWPNWIAEQIAAYEASGSSGIGWSGGLALATLVLATCLWLIPGAPRPREPAALLFFIVLILNLVVTFAIIPLPWQRYYLPLCALWAIYYALALAAAGRLFLRWGSYARRS